MGDSSVALIERSKIQRALNNYESRLEELDNLIEGLWFAYYKVHRGRFWFFGASTYERFNKNYSSYKIQRLEKYGFLEETEYKDFYGVGLFEYLLWDYEYREVRTLYRAGTKIYLTSCLCRFINKFGEHNG